MSEDEPQDRIVLYGTISQSSSEDRYVGIRALWLKVIIRAIFDWVSYRDSTKLQQKKLAENAHNWLFQTSELFNGLPSICEQLEIDIVRIREKARTMSKEEVAKIEHLERIATTVDDPSLLEAGSGAGELGDDERS